MKNFRVLYCIVLLSAALFISCSNDESLLLTNGGGNSTDGDGSSVGQPVVSQSSITLYSVTNGNITKVRDYRVTGENLSYQRDVAKHNEIWDLVTKIAPANQLERISEFMIYNGRVAGSSGFIVKKSADLSKWQLGLAIDKAYEGGFNSNGELAYTIIHEYGHILTLNHTQLDATVSERSCTTYYPVEGCSYENSYINEMYDLYWKDIENEHRAAQSSQSDQMAFYTRHSDRFVTNYASTNPIEDIAEVFSVFITSDEKPTGNSIADRKVLLMYESSELVNFREHTRQNVQLKGTSLSDFQLPAPGSWRRATTFGNPMASPFGH